MTLNLTDDAIKLICRLTKVLQGPYMISHVLLAGSGVPVSTSLIVKLGERLHV